MPTRRRGERGVEVASFGGASPRRSTILVVDDDPLIAMGAVDMLEDIGHNVLEAYSARQALEILKSAEPIDLLMTDHSMPGMTGVELVRLARDVRPRLPVLLVSGCGDLANGEASSLPRLRKPYHLSQLQAEIARLLGH